MGKYIKPVVSLNKQNKQAPLAPKTTEQEDIVTFRQSRINLLWEFTQSLIAISITGFFLFGQIRGIESTGLDMAFSFVVATYLNRVNHVKIGGIGYKPPGQTRDGS